MNRRKSGALLPRIVRFKRFLYFDHFDRFPRNEKATKFHGLTLESLAEVHGNRTHLTAFGRHTGFEVREPHQ